MNEIFEVVSLSNGDIEAQKKLGKAFKARFAVLPPRAN